jgi:two-component system OmpR family response regulator
MTVTPIKHDRASATSPAGRHTSGTRRRRVRTGVGAPAGLTVTFEITLSGENRYRDALEILDTLRQVTGRLGPATLDVAPSHVTAITTDPPSPESTGEDNASIRILPDSRSVLVAGEEISLTRVEFDLLTFLAENPRRVFGRSQLLKSVWGYEHTGHRTVDVHIRRIRAKLGDRLVTTVRSVGYRLAEDARISVGARTAC